MKRKTYRWVICIACMLLTMCTLGLGTTAFSVHQPYIVSANGFTNAQASGILTVRQIACIVSMLFVDRILKLLGDRMSSFLSMICLGLGFIFYGISSSYFVYILGAVFVGASQGIGGMVLVSIVIDRWFEDHKATAIGLCTAGSGISSIIGPPIITWLIENISLSGAFYAEAAFMITMGCIVLFLMRKAPEEETVLEPAKEISAQNTASSGQVNIGMLSFIVLAAAIAFMGCAMGVNTGLISMIYSEYGYGAQLISYSLSLCGITLVLSKLLFGVISDKAGGRRTLLLFGIIQIIGEIFICLSPLKATAVILAAEALIGFGSPIATAGVTIVATDFSSEENFAQRVKVLTISVHTGMLAFNLIAGVIADVTGSYLPVFQISVILLVFYCIVVQIIYKKGACGKDKGEQGAKEHCYFPIKK